MQEEFWPVIKKIELLLKAGANPQAYTIDNVVWTPIVLATRNKVPRAVEMLIKAEQVNEKDSHGETALTIAVSSSFKTRNDK